MSGSGRQYWRSLEELADSAGFAAMVEREMPRYQELLGTIGRRRFLQLMAASMALSGGLSGCGPEPDPRQLLPYVEQPPGIVPGRARYYATATTCGGFGTGVMVAHQMARPIKIEGNPDHPASLGAASAIMQASILGLYDPRRSQSIMGGGQIQSREGLITALFQRREMMLPRHGEGLRLLTGNVTSPSQAAAITALQQQFPAMRWHQWEPQHRDAEMEAASQAFGRAYDPVFDVASADVIFGIDSDLISAAPGHLAHARQFAAGRRPDETGGRMSRVYAIESTPTLLGAKADHRLPLRPGEIAIALRRLAAAVGAGPQDWAQLPSKDAAWVDAAAKDLLQHKGRALVHAGREQPRDIHLLTIAINNALGAYGATVRLIEPVAASAAPQLGSVRGLVGDMAAGRVDTLVMLDTNPVYNAPADLGFADALARVPFSLSLALYRDETAEKTGWFVPMAHEYEAWGDTRAFDGTVTIQQPQVRRLYGGVSAHEVLAALQGNTMPDDLAIVRGYWQDFVKSQSRGDLDPFWRDSLRAGVVAGTAAPPVTGVTPNIDLTALPAPTAEPPAKIDIVFRPDELVGDGRFADNAWLLEAPRPFTRLTWDNAALIAPATAKRLGLADQDTIEIAAQGRRVAAPVFVLPGQARETITLPLGFGRRAGGLGAGIGFDAYQMRAADAPWHTTADTVTKTGSGYRLATTQGHDRVAGRDLVREGTLARFNDDHNFLKQQTNEISLYPDMPDAGRAWAMSVDLNSCIGCQACVVACQAENNIPTVGKELVLEQRAMHWLRIDRYYSGSPDMPDIAFEPMPCMHCEQAPCEVVCPVHATVHDHEGLNLMVYNRCVGTRFCSNNCPYKVRRFNFFAFAHEDNRPPQSWNPEVTVRGRGVMEKCTYCIQRIRNAEIDADRDDRPIRDGELVTACQQSCPTQAIIFGDRNDRDSAVSGRKASPLDYVLLEDLNTRPRTSYTALIRNPNPDLAKDAT